MSKWSWSNNHTNGDIRLMSVTTIPTAGIADDAITAPKILNSSRLTSPIIINGDMSVAQRATSTTGIGADTAFVCDRWAYRKGGSPSFRATISQSTTVPTGQGFLTSLKVDCTTAQSSLSSGDRFGIDQKIEAQNLVNLKQGTSSADKTTLSFWVRSNLTGQFNIWIYKPDGTARSFVKAYTISSADTWEKKIINIPADTDSSGAVANDTGEGWRVTWMLAAGSTFSSGSIATSWEDYNNANIGVSQTNFGSSTDNEFYLAGVQLEVGEFDSTTIPSFPFESFENNLSKCQRYYHQIGHGLNGASGTVNAGQGQWYNSGEVTLTVYFPTSMRATPSMTSPTVSSGYRFHKGGSYSDVSDGGSINSPSNMMTGIFKSGLSGGTGGHASFLAMIASGASYKFDAEL